MKNPKIIAVDFDGTLATNKFPGIGFPINETIEKLKIEQLSGSKVILWTCRVDQQLSDALEWCHVKGINFDAVNENLPAVIEEFGTDTRKIFANEYWDDLAVRIPGKVFYLCDRKACDDPDGCSPKQCNHTQNIAHATSFKRLPHAPDFYIEKKPFNKTLTNILSYLILITIVTGIITGLWRLIFWMLS